MTGASRLPIGYITKEEQETPHPRLAGVSAQSTLAADGIMGVTGREAVTVTTVNEQPEQWPAEDDLPIAELARRQGVKPVASLDDLAQPDLWDSDQEYEDFLADLYASRRSDVA